MRGYTNEASSPLSSPTYDPGAALSLFNGDLTWDTVTAHLNTLRADPNWRVFVVGTAEGTVCDVNLIYKPTNAWYTMQVTKRRRLRGVVWRRTS